MIRSRLPSFETRRQYHRDIDRRERSRVRNACNHLAFVLFSDGSKSANSLLALDEEYAQQQWTCATCNTSIWMRMGRAQCQLCQLSHHKRCMKGRVTLYKPVATDQQSQHVDVTVCNDCQKITDGLRKFAEFRQHVSATKRHPLVIVLEVVAGMSISLHHAPSDETYDRQMAAIAMYGRVTPNVHPNIKELLVMPTKNETKAQRLVSYQVQPLRRSLKALAAMGGDDLNEIQKKHIGVALRQRVTLIHGPPGTGKTHIAAHLAVLVASAELSAVAGAGAGVVMCVCETNHAVDHLARKIVALQRRLTPLNIARVGLHASVAFQQDFAHLVVRDPSRRSQVSQLHAADIILCTNSAAATLYDKLGPVQLVIMDESDKATIPSAMIPLLFARHRVCLFGDHKQLSPYVHQQRGDVMAPSIFEHFKSRGVSSFMSTIQYRMHSSIASWPSLRFYSDKLESAPGIDKMRALPKGINWVSSSRVLFIETQNGEEVSQVNSFCNHRECEAVAALANSLDPESDVALLTGYTAQAKLLRVGLDCHHKNYQVSTVDAFQGLEADLVIISTVRTKKLGFMKNPKRINVMLTRARSGVVVYGKRDVLSRESTDWQSWFEFYDKMIGI